MKNLTQVQKMIIQIAEELIQVPKNQDKYKELKTLFSEYKQMELVLKSGITESIVKQQLLVAENRLKEIESEFDNDPNWKVLSDSYQKRARRLFYKKKGVPKIHKQISFANLLLD